MFTPPEDPDSIPHNILFVEDLTERVAAEFPELWKLGQAYFKGELHVEPDTGKVDWSFYPVSNNCPMSSALGASVQRDDPELCQLLL